MNVHLFVSIKNIFAHFFYNCTSLENYNSVKDCSNYVRMIKNHENHKFCKFGLM